ncbi:hypothetical protein ILUMI_19853 [Ignelater luminosus]|uniref:Uncharacterized protein n=1 Tax=Ignelater luminosus TaxID=2038154 RepID=A0A8K0FZH2_IGNLU|nr:hypothetical protein ILUMI_19853 [Ignelater luminosus]
MLLECVLNWNGLKTMEVLTILTGLYQILAKLYTSMKARKNLSQIIKKMEEFWSFEKYDDDLKIDIQQVYEYVKKLVYQMCEKYLLRFPPTLENIVRYGLLTSFFVIQLFFYCIAGNYLVQESEDVSSTVYNTNWWIKTQPELRRAYVLIIQRSNKIEELTAGGMLPLNFDSFRAVNIK